MSYNGKKYQSNENKRELLHFVYNGKYQKIIWLGVAGVIIINEPDKEILLIDPWISYIRADKNKTKTDNRKQRRTDFCKWLANSTNSGYKLAGILLSHEHFDHIDDIEYIYNALQHFNVEHLPPLYADSGSLKRIKNINNKIEFNKILLDGNDLFFDDAKAEKLENKGNSNYPLKVGVALKEINLKSFVVRPYIWDHMDTTAHLDGVHGNISGHYQRTMAYLISNGRETKTTFIVGSAGEMSKKFTGLQADSIKNIDISPDILMQAVTHEKVIAYDKKLRELVKYQKNNIHVKDAIIATHFEDFVDMHVPILVNIEINDGNRDILKNINYQRIKAYHDKHNRLIGNPNIKILGRFLIDKFDENIFNVKVYESSKPTLNILSFNLKETSVTNDKKTNTYKLIFSYTIPDKKKIKTYPELQYKYKIIIDDIVIENDFINLSSSDISKLVSVTGTEQHKLKLVIEAQNGIESIECLKSF